MKKYLFMRPVLTSVGEGRLFTGVVASALRILAVSLIPGSLVASLQLWKLVFNLDGAAILGGCSSKGSLSSVSTWSFTPSGSAPLISKSPTHLSSR